MAISAPSTHLNSPGVAVDEGLVVHVLGLWLFRTLWRVPMIWNENERKANATGTRRCLLVAASFELELRPEAASITNAMGNMGRNFV